MAIGTARMASLCLPNSELHVAVRWEGSPAMLRALGDPTRPAALLYPGEGAIDVMAEPPSTPITLVVVDGTWNQAKKLVRSNPSLAALPRYSFVPPAPSEYRIRREPREDYVSTIEALVHVLGALEGDAQRFAQLLIPFRAMIDTQIDHIERIGRPRLRVGPRAPRPQRQLPEVMRSRPADLVCVFGDANCWPHGSAHRSASDLAELLRWVALRPATGELFEAVLAPRTPLAPATPTQIGVGEQELRAGLSLPDFVAQWERFVRPDDVLCVWGEHSLRLLADAGALGERMAVDLRQAVATLESRRPGAVEQYHARLGIAAPSELAPGRAAWRVALLAAVVEQLLLRAP